MTKGSKTRPSDSVRLTMLSLGIASLAAVVIGSSFAGAAIVSGSMAYRNGKAAEKRQLHFENRVTGDMYVAPTEPDGSFSADLPPGFYDLRAERGVILKRKIRVDQSDLNLGRVVEPVPLDVHRPFQREGVAETIVVSPAPSTANLGGRPLEAMKVGHEAMAPFGAPAGTPVPRSTPLGEATPVAAPSPSAMN